MEFRRTPSERNVRAGIPGNVSQPVFRVEVGPLDFTSTLQQITKQSGKGTPALPVRPLSAFRQRTKLLTLK